MIEHQRIPKILTIDDRPENLFALQKLMGELETEVEVIQAESGLEALSLTLEHDFCLAIVDVQMPEMDGYEFVDLLRGNPTTASLPVIFVSAIYSDEYHHRKGYDAGAVDFMSKPFNPEILISKICVFLDLYHQRMKLNELAKQNAILYESEKKLRLIEEQRAQELTKLNASKDTFFSLVSQDLLGPVNNLVCLSQVMLTTFDRLSREDLEKQIDILHTSALSTSELLENLSFWCQIQMDNMGHKPVKFNLYDLVKNILTLSNDSTSMKEIIVSNSIPQDMIVFGDKSKIMTLLRNLLSNAIKFSLKNGSITFSAESRRNDFIEVSVTDVGVGMRGLDIDKLFIIDKPYTTVGTAGEPGTGLGLIICKALLEKMGGDIWVISEVGTGTTVKFTIPAL